MSEYHPSYHKCLEHYKSHLLPIRRDKCATSADSTRTSFQTHELSDNIGHLNIVTHSNFIANDDEEILCTPTQSSSDATVNHITISIQACLKRPCRLHWGCVMIADNQVSQWIAPRPDLRPAATEVIDPVKAVQSDLIPLSTDYSCIYNLEINIPIVSGKPEYDGLAFVFKDIDAPRWYKQITDNGADMLVRLDKLCGDENRWKKACDKFESTRDERGMEITGVINRECLTLTENQGAVEITAYRDDEDDREVDTQVIKVRIDACLRTPCVLHWGCVKETVKAGRRKPTRTYSDWIICPKEIWPEGTIVADEVRAVQTPLVPKPKQPYLYTLTITFPTESLPAELDVEGGGPPQPKGGIAGIKFVLKEANQNRWFKEQSGGDILVRIKEDQPEDETAGWKGSHMTVVNKIVEAEVDWNHMTLMHRFQLCASIMDEHFHKCQKLEEKQLWHDFWCWIYVWNRFSNLCWLDWQRNYNTKPRDLAHATEVLSCKVASFWRQLPEFRPWLKMTLSTMGRGGSSGQAIRDRILDIMHKHHIPEKNDHFYEQWHQKLHNNTTPDDIGICTAVIRYLESGGNMGEYWRVLGEYGITREKLASYERSIRTEPFMVQCDIGSLIWDFKAYLEILKDVHDSRDLNKSASCIWNILGQDLGRILGEVLKSLPPHTSYRDSAGIRNLILKMATLRKGILNILLSPTGQNDVVARDLLLMDASLEMLESLSIQGCDKGQFSSTDWTSIISAIVEVWALHHENDEEWKAISSDFNFIGNAAARNDFIKDSKTTVKQNALILKALVDRLTRKVGLVTDFYQLRLGPASEYLGEQVGVDSAKLNVFVDEVLRGSSLLALSISIKHLEPHLRQAAELPPWQLISWVNKTRGRLLSVKELRNIQDTVYDEPSILISDCVNGEEEIPQGVQGVLVRSAAAAPDILSHISVRARNAKALLAVCFDPDVIAQWEKNYQNQWVEIEVVMGGSSLTIRPYFEDDESVDEEEDEEIPSNKENIISKNSSTPSSKVPLTRKDSRILCETFDRHVAQEHLNSIKSCRALRRSTSVREPVNLRTTSPKFVIGMNEFAWSFVGAKSMNLLKLQEKLPNIRTPRAIALPYGSFQKALCADENMSTILTAIETALSELCSTISNQRVLEVFSFVHNMIMSLRQPAEFLADLNTALRNAQTQDQKRVKVMAKTDGLNIKSLEDLYVLSGEKKSWAAIKGVWASMFAMRPWVSLAKANRPFTALNMAILVQELICADYAFVLHSRNPFTKPEGKSRQMYGEIVVGLGEVLVANYPGRALSWTYTENDEGVDIVSFAAKSESLCPRDCLIFRSDSNGEDLEGFAGAGLFESIPAVPAEPKILTYGRIQLITDHHWREQLLKRIGKIAFDIEDAFEDPIDIEGVVVDNEIVIVQARPQIM